MSEGMRVIGGPLNGRTLPWSNGRIALFGFGEAAKHGYYQSHDGCWVWVEPVKEWALKKARNAK